MSMGKIQSRSKDESKNKDRVIKRKLRKTGSEVKNGKQNKIINIFELKKPLVCTICGNCYNDNVDYALHSKAHATDGNYSCHLCDKRTYKKDHFQRHVMSHNAYKCEECNKIFKRRSTALYHFHSGEKLYKCTICGKLLGSSWSLNSHLNTIHHEIITGKPLQKYHCTICNKHYLYESGLKLHYSSQHKELGIDFSVICDICGKRISCKSKLKQHLRTHTGDKPYACSVCSRKFTTKDLVTSHMRVHTGEKPYVCMYCGKEFAQGAPYRYHIKTHTGERSCNCPICGRGFISKGNMRIHVKSCLVPAKNV